MSENTQSKYFDWADVAPEYVARAQKAWERQQMALRMRQAGLTITALGARFGVCRERARQIIAAAERRTKHADSHLRAPILAWMNGTSDVQSLAQHIEKTGPVSDKPEALPQVKRHNRKLGIVCREDQETFARLHWPDAQVFVGSRTGVAGNLDKLLVLAEGVHPDWYLYTRIKRNGRLEMWLDATDPLPAQEQPNHPASQT